jgi:6-pyruvoyltetrahydropterin/6-carboxytetrahydropterin synthase
MFFSTKKFGHELGLSSAFRQWRADSHCRLIHGYALAVQFTFASHSLDVRNWVVDFGSLKSLKQRIQDTFDHKLLVAQDDPHLEKFQELDRLGLAEVVVVEATGCEAFAKLILESTEVWLHDAGYAPRCWVYSVEVAEHGANSAIYVNPRNELLHARSRNPNIPEDPLEWPPLEVGDQGM